MDHPTMAAVDNWRHCKFCGLRAVGKNGRCYECLPIGEGVDASCQECGGMNGQHRMMDGLPCPVIA